MPGTRRFALPRVRPIHALTLTLAVALLVAVGGWVVAVCGWPGAAPVTPTPEPQDDWFPRPGSGMHIEAPTGTVIEAVPIPPPAAALVPPTLEEQVFFASVIVRATLQSVTAGVELAPAGTPLAGPPPARGATTTYLPVQVLRFTVHEYLKGSGPVGTLEVVARGPWAFASQADAQAAADAAVAARTTTWDAREGVLFLDALSDPYTPAPTPTAGAGASGAASQSAAASAGALGFSGGLTWDAQAGRPNAWGYAVDTNTRAWLPARDAPAAGAGGAAAGASYITDGTQQPPPVVTLAAVKAEIAAQAATLTAGAGIAGYEECLSQKLTYGLVRRTRRPYTPPEVAATLASGAAAGAEIHKYSHVFVGDPQYHNWWVSGPDAARFQGVILDDDDDPANGYEAGVATARPLPAGSYRVHDHLQPYTLIPCNFKPDDEYVISAVTVTAPAGTVHEAFFDPVVIGSGVGADGSNGALEPTAFTVGETAVTLQRLSWEGRQLQLELSVAVALANHYLDVIALDGSVALRLRLADATTAATDAGGQAWRWPACASPWAAGAQLMLRLHHSATALTDVTTHPGCGPAPTFGAASYAFSIAEDAAVAAAVGTVAATGTGDDAVSYALTAGNDAGAFALDASTGALTVAGSLDYETTTSYSLTVQAVQATSLPATVSVAITITDAAEPPTFGESSYTFSVAEDAAVGAALGTVAATARANGAVSYAITAGNDAGAFALDASTGAITVASALDYETTTSYTLTVAASHGVSATTVSVAVTVTDVDEPPAFGAASYAFSVAEDAAVGAAVGTVAATGAGDAGVSHSITAGNAAGAFAIDGTSGAVTVAGALDYETTTSYTLTVQAVQGASDAVTVSVAVTVTDVAEPPTFGAASYAFSIAEDAAVAAAVGTVTATARASGAVSYAITAGNAAGAFAINAGTGAVTVAGALDYEATASYTLTVTASHGASPTTVTVTITVTDVEEPAGFGAASYAFSVAEDAAVGAAVGRVTATGTGDDPLSYALTAGNTGSAFAISASTGAIIVAGALDHETTASYTLTASASQAGSTAFTVPVTVTVTNVVEPPVFGAASYAFSVAENVGIPTTAGTVTATDPEGGDVIYYDITGGNEALVFAVDALAGRVVVGAFLDYETTTSYTLTVRAVDAEGDTGTVTVTVTVTDVAEPPAFGETSYAFSVAEDAAAAAAVGTVTATVRANGAVSYALTAGNTGDAFAIDADSGAITVAGALDRATTSSYTLTASASHGVSTTTVTVTITVTEAE